MDKKNRSTVEFVVSWMAVKMADGKPTSEMEQVFLLSDDPNPDPKTTTDKIKAARFTFNLTSSFMEELQIEREIHKLVGGLREWVELEGALESVENQMRSSLSMSRFKTETPLEDPAIVTALATAAGEAAQLVDLPAAGSPQERILAALQVQSVLDDMLAKTDSPLGRARYKLASQVIQIRWWALWIVLAVDVPTGWESVAELVTNDPDLQLRLHQAWLSARQEFEEGKQ